MNFVWQQKGWPNATVDRGALKDELVAFKDALLRARKFLRKPQDPEAVARALAQEAVKTSAIEGVNVDESVVMSSICKVLGVTYAPKGFTKDVRAEGVAQMVLAVRRDWNKPLTESLLKRWHKALLSGREDKIVIGEFRKHAEPMRVVRRRADGTVEIRYEAPPSERVPKEIRTFLKMWRVPVEKPVEVALKAAMLHPHFESIHPFEVAFSERAKKVILRMFEDGEEGVKAGLSASKWVRMAKVSKPTATRDLTELVAVGAIVREGDGPTAHYRLNSSLFEPIDGINEGINDCLIRLIATHPGARLPYLKSVVGKSTATVERAVAVLVKSGKIEHRGSKKTGGYYAVE